MCLFLISCHASAAISRIKRCSGTILMPTLRRSPLNWTSPKTSPRVETNEYWEVLKQCSFVSECKVKSLQIIQKPSYQELECTIIINLFNTPHSKKYLCPDYYMPIFLFVTKAPCAIWIFTFQFTPNTFSFKIKKKTLWFDIFQFKIIISCLWRPRIIFFRHFWLQQNQNCNG